jgi:hypothetical protein
MRVGKAELKTNELQELTDQMSEIRRTAVGLELKFRIEISVGDGSAKLTDQTLNSLNQLLSKISKDLELR